MLVEAGLWFSIVSMRWWLCPRQCLCCILICRFMHIYITTQQWRKTSEGFFKKCISLTLFVTFACERELETEQRLQYIDPPLLWPSALCRSRSPDAQPEARGAQIFARFLYHILSPTGLQNYWGSRGPLQPGVAFPTTSCL